MKSYLGIKLVNAETMTRGDYNQLRGWDLPANEDGADEGYLVEYTDGGTPNTLRYAGYINWSPKDVFERAYKPFTTPVKSAAAPRPEYQQRVVDEKAELDDKLDKLKGFLTTAVCLALPFDERSLLAQQRAVMDELSFILERRIELFK